MKNIENKESFRARLRPHFSPSEQINIQLAYCLAKFGHRAQVRKELVDGKPVRYFEHVRRAALVLMDEAKIMDKDMIIACLLHDAIEDTDDLTPEMIEHTFGRNVVTMVKLLSKDPKEGYLERLFSCNDWKVLFLKGCDKLDNQRSLMIPGTSIEFQKKQVKETKEKFYALFDHLLTIVPEKYKSNAWALRDEIRRVTERNALLIEIAEAKITEKTNINQRGTTTETEDVLGAIMVPGLNFEIVSKDR